MTGTVTKAAVAIGALLAWFGPAATVEQALAGQYEVRNCGGSAVAYLDGRFERYGDGRIDVAETCRTQLGGMITISQKNHGGFIPDGYGGGYRWTAPPGASIVGSSIRARLRNANGIAAQVYATDSDGGYLRLDNGTPHDGVVRDMEAYFPGSPRRQFAARLACLTSPPCRNRPVDPKAYIQIRRLALTVRDTGSPSVSAGGSLFTDSPVVRGSVGYSVSASDSGGGVWKLVAVVNGHEVQLPSTSCPGDRGGYTDRMRPCPASTSRTGSLDTARPPFRQGSNTVRLCARDYANGNLGSPTGPNTGCTSTRTITVDNELPPGPPGLHTVGGGGWRADNGFRVAWNAPSGLTTPIVEARYALFDATGAAVGNGSRSGTGITEIGPISVPGAGSYTVRVRLRDRAGNIGPWSDTELRFDDRHPEPAVPKVPDRWLGAADFPVEIAFSGGEAGGPSGISGYAVAIRASDRPRLCFDGRCSGNELKAVPDGNLPVIELEDLDEGRHWVSVAAVSGAGLISDPSPPVPIDVDKTDPTTTARGPGAEWTADPVTVTVSAVDGLSGLRPDSDRGARTPVTAVAVAGRDPVMRVGDSVAVSVASDGVHEIVHWARDLAGNANTGARLANGHRHDDPGRDVVRIDSSPPSVEFRDRPGSGPAERIWARVTDRLSGVSSGRIEYRPAGRDEAFRPLETSLADGWLSARFPSNSLPDGLYELKATAVDRAGNVATTVRRRDGTAMVLRNPVLPRPRLTALWWRERRARIAPAPGRPGILAGRLADPNGAPIARSPVEIVERFPRGARRTVRSTTVATDRRGRFRSRIRPGPTRVVTVRYRGSAGRARSKSRPLGFVGRGAIRLDLWPRIALNRQAIRMRGVVRVRDVRVPRRGKLVAIQYLDPDRGRWRPVEVIRTDRRGRFLFRYTFRTIAFPQRIIFRAVALPEAGWPYLPATSGPSPVVVYPR